MARQSHAAARQYLATEAAKDYDSYLDEYEKLEDENLAAMERSGWGSLIGSIGLPLAMSLLIPGGLSVAAGSLLAGIGSYGGAQSGEHWGGSKGVVGREGVTKRRLRSDVGRSLRENAKAYEGFGQEQVAGALSSAATAYMLGGGKLPGTEGWKSGGGLEGMFSTAPPGTAGVPGGMGTWGGITPETPGDLWSHWFPSPDSTYTGTLAPGRISGGIGSQPITNPYI